MGKRGFCFALALAFLCSISRIAGAEPVRIDFQVTVLGTHGAMEGIFGVPVHVGDRLAGTLTYDPLAPDLYTDPLYGIYDPAGEIAILYGSGVRSPIQTINVIDDRWGVGYDSDYFAAVSDYGNVPGFSQAIISTEFYGPPGLGSGDALPQTVAEFYARYFSRGAFMFSANQVGVEPPWDDTTHAIFGTLSLASEPAPVPEPGTFVLLATGAVGLVARMRRLT